MPSGKPWYAGAYRDWFAKARKAAALGPEVTFNALRHTFITASLLKRVPGELIAGAVDTSAAMIKRHYADRIAHHGEDLLRAAITDLGDFEAPAGEQR
jgi:hypothetical protein